MFKRKNSTAVLSENRREGRYPLEVEAIVFCGSDFFVTSTLNISSSGLQLAAPLPAHFKDKKIRLQVASDMENPKEFEQFFGIPVDEHRSRIKFCKENDT